MMRRMISLLKYLGEKYPKHVLSHHRGLDNLLKCWQGHLQHINLQLNDLCYGAEDPDLKEDLYILTRTEHRKKSLKETK
jgi:hypothetical protein